MDLIYGKTDIKRDPNFIMRIPESLARSILTSWTGQLETLNNQLSCAVPYLPNVRSDRGLNTILPLFIMAILDRLLARGNYRAYRGPTTWYEDDDLASLFITALPLSAKINYPFRMSASPITLTFLVTSSSIIQGTIGFYAMRNYRRSDGASSFTRATPIVDSANCLGVMNLATDRNITLTLSYDELYSLIDHRDYLGSTQYYTRAIVAYPLTPILSTTDTPTTIYFSVMYGVGAPRAAYLTNAPNLTLCQGVLPNTTPVGKKDRSGELVHKVKHASPLARLTNDFFVAVAKRWNVKYDDHFDDKSPK